MDLISSWNDILTILSTSFLAVNTLIFIPWRKSFRFMLGVTIIIIASLTISSSYFFFFKDGPRGILVFMLEFIWLVAVIYFAQYRDGRTLFSLLSLWTFCLSGYILTLISSNFVSSFLLRLLIALAIHLAYTFSIYFGMRQSFFSLMRLSKAKWALAPAIAFLPFILLCIIYQNPAQILDPSSNKPAIILICLICLILYLFFSKIFKYFLEQKQQLLDLNTFATHAKNAELHILKTARQEKQAAILRHDLKHFAGVITSCIQNQLYDEAIASVQSLLAHPAVSDSEITYSKIPILNALFGSYAKLCDEEGITFQPLITLNDSLSIDTMDLAVLLSNTLENAVNACREILPPHNRSIQVKLYMAGEQLFVSLGNSCVHPIKINPDTGLPMPENTKEGHGIGLLSVETFLQKYEAQVDCSQNNDWFQLRIIATPTLTQPSPAPHSKRIANPSLLRMNLLISILVIIGFVFVAITSFFSFDRLFRTDIEAVSRLTSETIQANVNSLMSRPINVSVTMSHDTLLKELMEMEAQNGITPEMTQKICHYLSSYQQEYQFDSVTLTSVKTGAHYHFSKGLSRIMDSENQEDNWFFELIDSEETLKLNIDQNKIEDYSINIFADSKLVGEDGNALGVIGVGMKTPYIQDLLRTTEDQYHVKSYLINETGQIQLSSSLTQKENVNLFEYPMFVNMKEALLQNKISSEEHWYSDGNLDGYIISKYIKNLNWYLVILKDTAELQATMLTQLFTGFVFMAAILCIILLITTSILSKYHASLMGLAQKDSLTRLRNRTSYEQEMVIYGARLSDYEYFSIGVFDLNNLKNINDTLGHQIGDEYLKNFASLLLETFSHCPLFRIGGDEFTVVFLNMTEEEIKEKWDLLQLSVDQYNENKLLPCSFAFGYAFRSHTLNNISKIFHEADRRMYRNKQETKDKLK